MRDRLHRTVQDADLRKLVRLISVCTLGLWAFAAGLLIGTFLMPSAKTYASTILSAFENAHAQLVGKAVVLTDGKAGTVEEIWLDEGHGLRISIRGHDGKWPVSTIKFAQNVEPA